jgi:hypothetical protein
MMTVGSSKDMARAAVHMVMRLGTKLEWTVQGFGMMRTYLDEAKRYRLNIWDPDLRVAGCSIIHNHPWHLTSLICSGTMMNVRYLEDLENVAKNFLGIRLKTGEGGGPVCGRKAQRNTGPAKPITRTPQKFTPVIPATAA